MLRKPVILSTIGVCLLAASVLAAWPLVSDAPWERQAGGEEGRELRPSRPQQAVATPTLVWPVVPVDRLRPLQPLEPLRPLQPLEPLRPLQPLEPLRPLQAHDDPAPGVLPLPPPGGSTSCSTLGTFTNCSGDVNMNCSTLGTFTNCHSR